jgi:hypothetical protein
LKTNVAQNLFIREKSKQPRLQSPSSPGNTSLDTRKQHCILFMKQVLAAIGFIDS